jgi:hypothetical protein
VEDMNMKSYFLKHIAALFSTLAVASVLIIFFPSHIAYAYTDGCIYNQTYSPENIATAVRNPGFSTRTIGNVPPAASFSPCTNADRLQVQDDLRSAYRQVFGTDGTIPLSNSPDATPGQIAAGNADRNSISGAPIPSGDCEKVLASLTSWTCLLRSVANWVAATIIWVAVTIMAMVGWLFDIAINQTVIGFNSLISSILDAIKMGWTLFRDIANIAIIGLFVFIAINMILGNKSYGERKLIARVLVVAVLINFSFLFTQIVIDFSTALAVQFAKPLAALNTSGAGTSNATSGTVPDIAGKFTDLMGVREWNKTKDALDKIATKNDNGWIALMHAFLVVIVALGVSLVLLYGAILLITRAIILIFLMITSSFAFATYLLPTLAESDFGWKQWWVALFRNALLAPAMMLFLFLTLKISASLTCTLNPGASSSCPSTGATSGGILQALGGGGSLGDLGTDPSKSANVTALLLYLLILGLLYGAIKLSNRFAGAAGAVALAGTAPFANASLGAPFKSLGFLGRNTVGRVSYRIGQGLEERAKNAKGNTAKWALYSLGQAAKQPGKWSFNAANATGIKAGQTKGKTFEADEKKRADYYSKLAKATTHDDNKAKKIAEDARADAKKAIDAVATKPLPKIGADGKLPDGSKPDKPTLIFNEAHKQAEGEIAQNNAQIAAADRLKNAAEATISSAQVAKQTLQSDIEGIKAGVKDITDKKEVDRTPQEIRKVEQANIEIKEKERVSKEQDRVIEDARATAAQKTQEIVAQTSFGEQLQARLATRTRELAEVAYARELAPNVMDEKGRVMAEKERIGNAAAEQAYERFSNTLFRVSGLRSIEDDPLARGMHKSADKYLHHEKEAENARIREHVRHEEAEKNK